MKKIANEYNTPKLIVSAFLLLIYMSVIFYCSASPLGALATWAASIVFIALPGFAFATWLARCKGTDIPSYMLPLLSVIMGCAVFAVAFCFTARLGSVVFMLAPPLLAIVFWAKKMPNVIKQFVSVKSSNIYLFLKNHANYILLWSFLLLLYATSVCLPAALPSATGAAAYPHVDFLWNIGNAKSFLLGFPPENIRFSEVRLAYHYFTELLWGGVARVSGVDAYNVIMFFSPPLTLCGLIVALRSLGMFFYKENRRKTAFFIFVLLFGSCASTVFVLANKGQSIFFNNNLIHLITNINAQGTAVIFLCGFTALLGIAARNKFKVNYLQLLLTAGSFVMLSVSKGPAAAIVLCGFLLSMLMVLIFQRPNYLRAILLMAILSSAFYAIYMMLFSAGANNSVVASSNTVQSFLTFSWLEGFSDKYRLALIGTALICIIQALLTMPLQFTLYFPVLFRDIKRLFTLPIERLLAHSCVAGGLLAYILFWHSSGSQAYFLLLAIFFISLLAADFDFKIPKLAMPVYVLSGAVAVATSICIIISMLFGIYRPSSGGEVSISAQQALQMLNQVSAPSERFATNRIHSQSWRDDGISNICTAISGRQAYMEGYSYEKSNMGIDIKVINEHIATNESLFNEATLAEDISIICAENNIDYILFFTEYGGSNSAIAASCQLLYENDGVYLYKVM